MPAPTPPTDPIKYDKAVFEIISEEEASLRILAGWDDEQYPVRSWFEATYNRVTDDSDAAYTTIFDAISAAYESAHA